MVYIFFQFVYLERNNYYYENHTIKTEDGYILLTVRIPYGKNASSNMAIGPPVLFMHCILCTFYDFLNAGPERAIGFEILEQGYDVWLLNIRGNTYSRKHVTLDPDLNPSGFWNFRKL
ncbi:hypothetical protein NQ314_018338 [Rhamnusium bicolor]|uniref:Partial AB-hydrolase lipase domain-containing protein n=1 Tax=Rhamnusium bicolor TaxID=1586634 RepID=A0AAV8WR01_9CUCU|nr:hypothetical protein NQ314_018338 [Rhamnusium bicolor]